MYKILLKYLILGVIFTTAISLATVEIIQLLVYIIRTYVL